VVYGLDYIPGKLLLVQEVAGCLLEGVGAVKVSPAGYQQVHDVRMTVGCGYVKWAGGWEKIIDPLNHFITTHVINVVAWHFTGGRHNGAIEEHFRYFH